MAKNVGAPGSGGRGAVFTGAAYSASSGAPAFSYTQEQVAAMGEEAVSSGYVADQSAFMGGRDPFGGLPSAPAGNPNPKSGNFFEASVITNTTFGDNPTSAEIESRQQALRNIGLNPQTDFATRYYDPVDPDSALYDERDTPNFVKAAKPMAGLLDIPTSTTNYSRPRTVAAGWSPNSDDDPYKGTLTVVFRDGTPYNFYDVERSVWIKFHSSISKGKPFLNRQNSKQPFDGTLLAYSHGPADVGSLDEEIQAMIYTSARAQQVYNRNPKSGGGHYQTQYKKVKNPTARQQSKIVGYAKTGEAIVKTRVKTYGSPTNPGANNPNVAENRRIAQGEAAARQRAKANQPRRPHRATGRKKK